MSLNPASHAFRMTAEKIGKRIALVAPLVHRARVPLERFRLTRLPEAAIRPGPEAATPEILDWNGYWGGQDLHFVLRSRVTIPKGWAAPALHLPLGVAGDIFTHPEALLYLDGTVIGSADRYHHTIALDPALADGAPHEIVLHGWTGLSGWPPDPEDRTRLFLRPCHAVDLDRSLQDFVTRAEVALDHARHLPDDRPEREMILTGLDRAFGVLDTRDPLGVALRESVAGAGAALDAALAQAGPLPGVRLHAIGHAHMDVAYLWPVAQIRQKNARTYANVLRLMERYPDFTFSHSQPQLYAWTRADYPEIFEAIRRRVAEGRWEVLGGMWIEPDANMPGGESLVRQILLARRWSETHLPRAETPVLWLPDTFGFPASLPQLMQQAGLEWFVTNKLNWNQYNRMPSSTTWWEGIDGTRVLAHFLTTPREVQHLPFPTNYKSDLSAREVMGTWSDSTARHAVRDLPICYGYGDGGGGPTDELVRKARAWDDMPGAPRLTLGTVRALFETLETHGADLPVWRGELYMEGHRGTLTSQGWIKQANRRNEGLLHAAEFLQSLAVLHGHSPVDLTRAWELLCLNQFHDILTGTAVTAVFDDARRDHAEIGQLARTAMQAAVDDLIPALPHGATWLAATGSPLPAPHLAYLPAGAGPLCGAHDGTALATQESADGLLVDLTELPAYAVLPLAPAAAPATPPSGLRAREDREGVVLENPYLRLLIGPDGRLHGLADLEAGRDVLAGQSFGNSLSAFEDRPVSWDAWDVDAFFDDREEVLDSPCEVDLVETGPLRALVETNRQWRNSTIRQRIILRHNSRRIDFETEIDWHETHTLLKVAFPVAIHADWATYDIQFGQVSRPTHESTARDAALFEVCAQKWVDLGEAGYGVALMNNGKYGHDVRGNVLRLSLLKSPTMPDAVSDQGVHRFTYGLMPHPGDWRESVPAEAYALNHPVRMFPVAGGSDGALNALVRVEAGSGVVETLKPAEDRNGVILRLYEGVGARGETRLRVHPGIARAERCGPLEEAGAVMDIRDGVLSVRLRPHEIVTLRLIPT